MPTYQPALQDSFAPSGGSYSAEDFMARGIDPVTMQPIGNPALNQYAGTMPNVPALQGLGNIEDQMQIDPRGGGGALNQQRGQLLSAVARARQQKLDAIQQAMQILQASKSGQTTNLPLLAWGSAMGAPTRGGTFSESLSNAGKAAIDPIEQQRAKDMSFASAMGTLGTESADVGLHGADQDLGEWYKGLDLSEKAGTTGTYAAQRAYANELTNSTRLATNAATNAARDRATMVRSAYNDAIVDLRGKSLDEKTKRDLASQKSLDQYRADLEQLNGSKYDEKTWNDYQSRVNGAASSILLNSFGKIDPADAFAQAAAVTPPPPLARGPRAAPSPAVPATPGKPTAPGPAAQPPPPSTAKRPSLDDIFTR